MSKDTILKIKETEAEAARIVAEAEAKAREMRERAETEGLALCRSTEETLTVELDGMLKKIQEKVDAMGVRTLDETREQAEAVASAARLNRKSAEKIVIRGLDAKCR